MFNLCTINKRYISHISIMIMFILSGILLAIMIGISVIYPDIKILQLICAILIPIYGLDLVISCIRSNYNERNIEYYLRRISHNVDDDDSNDNSIDSVVNRRIDVNTNNGSRFSNLEI